MLHVPHNKVARSQGFNTTTLANFSTAASQGLYNTNEHHSTIQLLLASGVSSAEIVWLFSYVDQYTHTGIRVVLLRWCRALQYFVLKEEDTQKGGTHSC